MTRHSTHMQRGKPANDRFDEKINKTSACWEWTSAKGYNGYGIFWLGDGSKRSVFAHRFAWERTNAATIPAGMVVMHLCNNKGCVNPDHLALGTAKENALAASRDGLAPRGERNGGGGKLTEIQVREILEDKTLGCWKAARKYCVSAQTIKAIRRREIWRHVDSTD